MIILPAIDLKNGQCVRLKRGEFQTAHQVADSAFDTAQRFRDAGARWIHMVDLDGARNGIRENFPIIDDIIRHSGLKVELGGGIRTEPDLITAVGAGAAKVVIGSAAVANPGLVEYALRWCPRQVALGVDVLDEKVRVSGWEADSGIHYLDFIQDMLGRGINYIIFTDITTDGMLTGPAWASLSDILVTAKGAKVVASGGIRNVDDVKRLRDMGIYGAIVGKAYYAGTIDLEEAILAAGDQDGE